MSIQNRKGIGGGTSPELFLLSRLHQLGDRIEPRFRVLFSALRFLLPLNFFVSCPRDAELLPEGGAALPTPSVFAASHAATTLLHVYFFLKEQLFRPFGLIRPDTHPITVGGEI